MKTLPFRSALFFFAIILCMGCQAGYGQNVPDTVAGIPVNYNQLVLEDYTLPELLTTEEGERIETAAQWMDIRRDEILDLYRTYQYGSAPEPPGQLHFEVFDEGTEVFGGKAVRKQVRIYLTREEQGPKMDLVVYLPENDPGPSPVLLYLSFVANSMTIDDPGIRRGEIWGREQRRVPAPEESPFGNMDIEPFIDSGIGFASVYYGDIEPDFAEGIRYGIRSAYLEQEEELPGDHWGAICAWAWGLSRAVDYFETDPDVDEERIAILGASRLGKTVLWAGARDQRFAAVIASCSGEGGAALSRREYGETIAHLTAPSRYPYQFCPNYSNYGHRVDEFPVDAHMLISLMAPRPLLLQTGDTDYWSDPLGEYMSAVEAGRVYRLFGEDAPGYPVPPAGKALYSTLGYFMHSGGHGFVPADFDVFIRFLKKHL